MKTATTISSNLVKVNNKFNEELNIDDDLLIQTDSGTKLVTITEIVDAKESIVKTKNFVASGKGRICPNCRTEMPLAKKGKGFKKYTCTCGCWATKTKSTWFYSE